MRRSEHVRALCRMAAFGGGVEDPYAPATGWSVQCCLTLECTVLSNVQLTAGRAVATQPGPGATILQFAGAFCQRGALRCQPLLVWYNCYATCSLQVLIQPWRSLLPQARWFSLRTMFMHHTHAVFVPFRAALAASALAVP